MDNLKSMIQSAPEAKIIGTWLVAWFFAFIDGQVEVGIFDLIIKILTITSLLVAISYTLYKWVHRIRYNKRNNNTK